MELILIVFISGGIIENSQNGASRSRRVYDQNLIFPVAGSYRSDVARR